MKQQKPLKLKKRKPQDLNRYAVCVTDVVDITEQGLIKYKNGTFAGIYDVPGVDIENMHTADQENQFAAFDLLIKSINGNIKIISVDAPPNHQSQIQHLHRLLEETDHPYRHQFLEREINVLRWYEEKTSVRKSYIIVYSGTEQLAHRNERAVLSLASSGLFVRPLNQDEVLELLHRILPPYAITDYWRDE